MTDDELAITCIAGEAGNQPHEGKAAVGIVILNRVRLPYASDGTISGAVLHKWAFSEFWAGMTNGRYQALAAEQQGAPEAEKLFAQYSAQHDLWADCTLAWKDAQAWHDGLAVSFAMGPQFQKLTGRTVLYLNPKIVHPLPAWATIDKQDAVIYDHTFYHD